MAEVDNAAALTTVIILVVIVLLLLVLLKLSVDRRRLSTIIDLPGPRGLPFVGNAFQLDRRRPWETFDAWRRVYGDAYLVRLFSEPVVVLAGPATIREALVDRGREFAGRPRPFYRAGFMSDRYQDVVSGSPGPVWSALRRAVQRAMKTAGDLAPGGTTSGSAGGAGRRTEQLTASIVDEMCDEFAETGARPFDPRPAVYDAVMNMTCLMLIGDRFRRDDDELAMYKRLERLVTTSMGVGGSGSELDVFPWLRHFGNATYRKLVEAKRLRDVLYDRIRARVETAAAAAASGDAAASRRGVAQALFDALADDDGRRTTSGVTENNIKLAIVNLLVGGAAATTGYIYVAMNVLAQNPDVQAKIRAEVDAMVGSSAAGGDGANAGATRRRRPIGLDDKPSMPYTSAAVVELLRYASLSPILIPHRTMTATAIGTVRIPAGVQVFMHVRAVHHDETFWIDPYRYRPERFLREIDVEEEKEDGGDEEEEDGDGGDSSAAETSNVRQRPRLRRRGRTNSPRWCLIPPDDERRRRVMSFGAGPRACPGEAIAMTRLFLTVANVVRRFVIEPEDETTTRQTSCDPRTYDPGLVLSPKDFRVRFVAR